MPTHHQTALFDSLLTPDINNTVLKPDFFSSILKKGFASSRSVAHQYQQQQQQQQHPQQQARYQSQTMISPRKTAAGARIPTSPSPPHSRSRCVYPFAGAMNHTSFKSPLSPPQSTLSHDSYISPPSSRTSSATSSPCSSVSSRPSSSSSTSSAGSIFLPSTPPSSSMSSPSFSSTAYPDWPKRDILSPLSSFCGSQASSYISDEDLLCLDHLSLKDEVDEKPKIVTKGMEWEGPPPREVAGFSLPVQSMRRVVRPMAGKRRRSSPLHKQRMRMGPMTPIAE